MSPTNDTPYATDSGFYIGDEVELPDGRVGCIDEIVKKDINYWSHGIGTYKVTLVRLDDEYWLDTSLTRI